MSGESTRVSACASQEGKPMSKNELSRSHAVAAEPNAPISHWRLARGAIEDNPESSSGARDSAAYPVAPRSLRPGAEISLVHVASVLRALQVAEIPERQIEIVLETDEALTVAAEPLFLTSAISSLLDSAIQFSRDGARVILRSRPTEDGVSIEVEDECGGLHSGEPAENFPAAVRATHRDAIGRWFTTARRFAEAMNGCLVIEQQPGVGCTFALILPNSQRRPSESAR
jgi:signal transduction histidine kinase